MIIKYHINLDYLEKLGYTNVIKEKDELQRLLYFIVCEDKDKLDEVYKGDTFMAEIIKKAKEIAGKEKMPLYLADDEIRRLDQEYHYNKGAETTKKEMIINFYNNQVSIDIISKSSNLSVEEVEKIIKEYQDSQNKE